MNAGCSQQTVVRKPRLSEVDEESKSENNISEQSRSQSQAEEVYFSDADDSNTDKTDASITWSASVYEEADNNAVETLPCIVTSTSEGFKENTSHDSVTRAEADLAVSEYEGSEQLGHPLTLSLSTGKRKLLKISADEITVPDSPISDEEIDKVLSTETDTQDEEEHLIIQQLDSEDGVVSEKIPELSAEEERADFRNWKTCVVGGEVKKIDMKVIEPYKRVLSHGGYVNVGGQNAIISFSACYLPHKSRVDYSYVMDNLFLYILFTLNQLVTDDYVLVYFHGGASKDCMPSFSWLKKCYQLIDRRLKKNLKSLYLVHPTFWLKTLLVLMKPFISSKFRHKVQFINSLGELRNTLPVEEACIPDRVKQYDNLKMKFAK